jgi:hypothetical protein
MDHVSDIKLIRTDTTLDLSQKAEKGMLLTLFPFFFYKSVLTGSGSFCFGVGLEKLPRASLFKDQHARIEAARLGGCLRA